MIKTTHFILLATVLINCSCSNNDPATASATQPTATYSEIKRIDWLIGSWQGTSPDGLFGESWQKSNDSIYTGKGFFIVGKDTVSSEVLRLVQEGSKLFYEPTVKNQNDGKAVRFEMTSMTENSMIFENPAHDFPQKISYLKITPDSIVASISGMMEGKASEQVFPMKRTN